MNRPLVFCSLLTGYSTPRFLPSFVVAQPSKAEIQFVTKKPMEVLDDLTD